MYFFIYKNYKHQNLFICNFILLFLILIFHYTTKKYYYKSLIIYEDSYLTKFIFFIFIKIINNFNTL